MDPQQPSDGERQVTTITVSPSVARHGAGRRVSFSDESGPDSLPKHAAHHNHHHLAGQHSPQHGSSTSHSPNGADLSVSPPEDYVDLKPREFFVGRRHVPFPPPNAVPLNGITMAESPAVTDITRTAFSPLLLVLAVLLVLAAVALVLLTMFEVLLHDVADMYRFGAPAVVLLFAIFIAYTTTATEAHFDREHRVLVLLKKRFLLGGCCGGRREIPFSVFSSLRPSTSHGVRVDAILVINASRLAALVADDAGDQEDDMHTAGPPSASADVGAPNSQKSRGAGSDDGDSDDVLEDITIANIENAPDVLRSWRNYIAWLRDDAF